jgi:hypothetical protein
MTELLILAPIGFASQLVATCVAAFFAWVAAKKLATTVADLARNTRITERTEDVVASTHDAVEATRNAVDKLERPFLTRDWSPPGAN